MTEQKRWAEEEPYFDTTVHPAKSMGEIQEMLDDFGAGNVMVASGKSDGKHAWMIRFGWMGKSHRFVFKPKVCNHPYNVRSFGGKRRTFEDQSLWQMGRTACHFVKAILSAAEDNPDALFGFIELEGKSANGIPLTTAELNIGHLLAAALPEMNLPRLSMDSETIEGEVTE